MRLTPALAVRNLIAKLHPPLSQTPQTPRESQQLLSVLQNSFNRRLDDAHPSPQIHSKTRNRDTSVHTPDIGNVSANATNAHLQAILSHPSLEQAPVSSTKSSVKIIELFDAAVLAQTVNFLLIRNCVHLAKTGLTPTDRAEAAHQLGPRIAAWFTASDAATQKAFLADSDLMSGLIPMMYQADLEGTIWDWLRTLYESSAHHPDLLAEDRFIALMIRESIKRRDLSAAVLEYSEACEYRSSRALPETIKGKQAHDTLAVTSNLVSSAVLLRRHRHGITAPLYDRLLSHMDPDCAQKRTVLWPFLPIYHPAAPQYRPFYEALQDSKYIEALLRRVASMQRDRAMKILISILDGADLTLSQGSKDHAQFILDFAQQHFPSMLPENRSADVGDLIRQARRYVSVHKHGFPELAIT